ncbi:MAG: hypothetical protein OQK82_09370 [Candidatus Pacearchaeota archaeon]|nr:hypothetical protein [Candidatus Pacearchaeota archaeon]
MKRRIILLFIAILSGLLIQMPPVANAQDKKPESQSTRLVTAEVLKSRIAEVEVATNLLEASWSA